MALDKRYLCLGGIEVVNNCRTLTYVRNLGMPGLKKPPMPESCCCPAITPPGTPGFTCDLSVTLNVDVADDGIHLFTGPATFVDGPCVLQPITARVSMLELAEGAGPPSPIDRADPGWTLLTPSLFMPGGSVTVPYPDGTHPVLVSFRYEVDGAWAGEHVVYFPANTAVGDWGTGLQFAVPAEDGTVAVWVPGPAGDDPTPQTFGGFWPVEFPAVPPAVVYTDPATDDAPWYDPAVPESADLLGVLAERIIVSVPYDRTMRPRQRGGTLAAGRWMPREVHVTGWLYARTVAAARYGRQWLFEALTDGSCDGECDLPDLVGYRTCCSEDVTSEKRTLKRVGLVGPPNFDLEPEMPEAAGYKVEFTLQAEEPFMYGEPDPIGSGLLFNLIADPECNICSAVPSPAELPACGHVQAPVRVVTRDGTDDSWCRPTLVRRRWALLPGRTGWTTAAAVVKVKAGTVLDSLGQPGLQNLRIVGYSNPLGIELDGDGLPTFDPDGAAVPYSSYFLQGAPCIDIEVSCLPADAELVIDTTTRTATVSAGNVTGSGYPYLSSGGGGAFRWPEVDCAGLMLLIEADHHHTAPDSTYEVVAVPQERG